MSVTHQAATLVEYVPETAAKISETKRLSMKMAEVQLASLMASLLMIFATLVLLISSPTLAEVPAKTAALSTYEPEPSSYYRGQRQIGGYYQPYYSSYYQRPYYNTQAYGYYNNGGWYPSSQYGYYNSYSRPYYNNYYSGGGGYDDAVVVPQPVRGGYF